MLGGLSCQDQDMSSAQEQQGSSLWMSWRPQQHAMKKQAFNMEIPRGGD